MPTIKKTNGSATIGELNPRNQLTSPITNKNARFLSVRDVGQRGSKPAIRNRAAGDASIMHKPPRAMQTRDHNENAQPRGWASSNL